MAIESTFEADGTLVLKGALTKYTLGSLQDRAMLACAPARVDLAQVELYDSSLLALLADWSVRVEAIEFVNVPSRLRDMAKTAGLDQIINISSIHE